MRVRKLILAASVIATATLGVGGYAMSAATPAAAYATTSCVRLPNHNNWECVSGGGFYWTDNLQTREGYLHGSASVQTVMEQYFCQNDQETANGHPTCKGNSAGVPANTPRWERRVISLADGCTIYGWDVPSGATNPAPPTRCTLYNGSHRATTASERTAVLTFWRDLREAGGYW